MLLLCALVLMGQRDPILVPEVSQHEVQVRQGFTGTELLLFGAILDPGGRVAGNEYDIVVVLKGPSEAARLREKERFAGVWVNAASTDFRSVPSFFAVASSRPVSEIVDEKTAAIYEFGTDYIQLSPSGVIDTEEQARFAAGLVDLKTRQQLYKQDFGGVQIAEQVLYQARITLPSNVTTGTYTAETFAVSRTRHRLGAVRGGSREGRVREAGGRLFAGLVARLRPARRDAVGRHGVARGSPLRDDLRPQSR